METQTVDVQTRPANITAKPERWDAHLLRCFAALGVMFLHLSFKQGSLFPFGLFSDYGLNGVAIFFVLSGYLAFLTYRRDRGAGYYYKKRVVRILPAYYIALGVYFILRFLVFGETKPFSLVRFVLYCLGLHQFVPSGDYYLWNNVNTLWTMSAFFFFYAILPLLIRWVKSLRGALVFFLLMILLKAFTEGVLVDAMGQWFPDAQNIGQFTMNMPFRQMYLFALGVLVYAMCKEGYAWHMALVSGLVTVFFLLYYGGHAKGYEAFGGMTAFVLSICSMPKKQLGLHVFLGEIQPSSALVKLTDRLKQMAKAVIRWGSQISFTLYLTHEIVIELFYTFPAIQNTAYVPFFADWNSYAVYAFMVVCMVGFACVVRYLLERPLQRVLKKLLRVA